MAKAAVQPTPQDRTQAKQAKKATSQTKVKDRQASRRAPVGTDAEDVPDDQEGEEIRSDLGPWVETPSSSRVRAYRYDYLNREIQVTWRNQNNPGYAYEDRSYEDFRAFVRIASKGKYINRVLNFGYRRLTQDEVDLPSNPERRGATSRARG